MRTDKYGQQIFTEDDICRLYLLDPGRTISHILTDNTISISDILELENKPNIEKYIESNLSINEFDTKNQSQWLMPESYKQLDIAKYVLDLCQSNDELQRVGQELLMYQERDMFDMLRYLKYLVDTMRQNNIVWGVGRGSSVASFVLFLLGVHRINSLYYDLSIDEFLK
jgi:DNA polymerase III alpha subunit